MNIENKIIKTFSSENKYIGDDCAYISETKQLITTDIIVENTHFDLKNFSETQIAHRLFLSNYSDIQSSGGEPQYALFNISFPKNKTKIALSISRHLKRLAKNNNIDIIGGDTTKSKNIYLSLTLISKKIPKSKILLRSKAKINDEIYIFKNIGFSKLGFLSIFNKFKLPSILRKKSRKQFLQPKFYKYFNLFNKLSINSAMDVSDSLHSTLKEMAYESKKKFIIDDLSLVNPSLFKYFNNKKYFDLILGTAEEYVPVFTVPKNSINKKMISLFKKKGIGLIRIGNVSKGKGLTFLNVDLKNINTYDHFNENYLKL
tara:strand:+ start:792 stop:1739 length:948 start_codon:yes stop_codon:yes gene_type:complete